MSYIKFEEYGQGKDSEFHIINSKDELLGYIKKVRVGQWMSWCLTSIESSEIYFSASCLDKIREKIKELNAERR